MPDATPFPISLKLEGRACLVVGNGREAALRAQALLEAGARVRLVSESADRELSEWVAGQSSLSFEARGYRESDLDGVWLAVLTDRNAELAARIDADAEAKKVLFCAVDQPAYGSFTHVARATAGDLTLAIGTAGRAPALARRLREIFQELFDEANMAAFVERLAELRERTPSTERARVLGDAVKALRFEGRLTFDRDGDSKA
jgi:precorrin-2 dehydrogenase/sirohydrochlorin ferrochelatase